LTSSRVFFIAVLIFIPVIIFSQQLHYEQSVVHYLSPEDRELTHLARDAQGYFYIFSKNSIFRFDGYKVEPVNIDKINAVHLNPLKINQVGLTEKGVYIELFEDEKNIL